MPRVTKTAAGLSLLLLLATSGCGDVRQRQALEHQKQIKVAVEQCATEYPAQYVKQSDCKTSAENTLSQSDAVPNKDLIGLYQAQRKVIAVKIDSRSMSPEDGQLSLARTLVELHQTELERQAMLNASIPPAPQGPTDSEQLAKLSAAFLQPQRAPTNTTCNRMGAVTNCTTY